MPTTGELSSLESVYVPGKSYDIIPVELQADGQVQPRSLGILAPAKRTHVVIVVLLHLAI